MGFGGFNPKQLQELMSKAREQAQRLEETIVEGSAGGGSVTIRMNGKKQVLRAVIDPEAVKAGDHEMLQDLIAAAFNDASRKVDEAMQSQLGGMLSGMGIPGI